jgi:hypothetical protein
MSGSLDLPPSKSTAIATTSEASRAGALTGVSNFSTTTGLGHASAPDPSRSTPHPTTEVFQGMISAAAVTKNNTTSAASDTNTLGHADMSYAADRSLMMQSSHSTG